MNSVNSVLSAWVLKIESSPWPPGRPRQTRLNSTHALSLLGGLAGWSSLGLDSRLRLSARTLWSPARAKSQGLSRVQPNYQAQLSEVQLESSLTAWVESSLNSLGTTSTLWSPRREIRLNYSQAPGSRLETFYHHHQQLSEVQGVSRVESSLN